MILNTIDIVKIMKKNPDFFYDVYQYLNEEELNTIKQHVFDPLTTDNYNSLFYPDLVEVSRKAGLKTNDSFINYLLFDGKKPTDCRFVLNKILNLVEKGIVIKESIIDECLPELIPSINYMYHHFFEIYHNNIVKVLLKRKSFLPLSIEEDNHFFIRLVNNNQLIDLLPFFNQRPSDIKKYEYIKEVLYNHQDYQSNFKLFIRLMRKKDIRDFIQYKNLDSQDLIKMIIENNLYLSKTALSLLSDNFQQRGVAILDSAKLLNIKDKQIKQLFINEFLNNKPIVNIELN